MKISKCCLNLTPYKQIIPQQMLSILSITDFWKIKIKCTCTFRNSQGYSLTF